jgi:hypothetical protein
MLISGFETLVLIDIFGSGIVAALSGYGTYRIVSWRNSQLMKKMHPDEKNGLNLVLNYKVDGTEVFGIRGSGVDLMDMWDNMSRGFNSWRDRKDDIIKRNREKEAGADAKQ